MDSKAVHEHVQRQFSPTAASYATSSVHADAEALAKLVELAQATLTDRAIDVATGAGHMALALAPHVESVVAFDLTQTMLDQTLATAQARGLANVTVRQGEAESMPYPSGSFDLYTVRLAPHHFADIQATIDEAARILRPGGRYLVADTSAPGDLEIDEQIHEIEKMRDPSHVRNYPIAVWTAMLERSGLTVEFAEYGYLMPLDLDDWMTRMSTPAADQAELHRRFRAASPALVEALKIEVNGEKVEFSLPRATVLARKLA